MKVGSPVWHSKRIEEKNVEFPRFELPYKIVTRLHHLTVHRFYIEKTPTEEDLQDEYAEKADYLVDSVRPQNKAVRVILKKRTAE